MIQQYPWPEWMPEKVRAQLSEFWGCFGRTMADWERYVEESVPGGMGAVGETRTIRSHDGPVTGRFVPAWNNMARVVMDDGTFRYGSFEQTSGGARTILQADWLEWGVAWFGPDTDGWLFQCPGCGNQQSVNSVLKDNPELNRDDVKGWIYYSCQGRYGKGGCDWTLGGFLRLHKLEVVKDDGSVMPVFEFHCKPTGCD